MDSLAPLNNPRTTYKVQRTTTFVVRDTWYVIRRDDRRSA